ncbi:vWA domain-containing protein [Aureispira anguillae]|uniref:VWA domain-containing protein n=1 Tax=Aureispira anguillae TaxID=2864201 RepID=A0A915YJE8_9BACT|nr:VWA domain-containing protein [Aureispira anguillae]BDS14315.1 VWA domain-containing protein [Aureispira anguillae]
MKKSQSLFLIPLLFSMLFSCENSNKLSQVDNTRVSPPVIEERAMATEAAKIEQEAELDADYITDEPYTATPNTEEYDKIVENTFQGVAQNPLSTFSIDVDNASYSNVRRFLEAHQLPQANAVRIEEMINYFDYDYAQPKGEHPFSIHTEMSTAPWNTEHHLIHIGLQGKDLDYDNLKPSNLVFLIDASGSMGDPNKLPLLKKSLKLLLAQLDDKDRVAIVAYAGAAGLVLPSTPASQTNTILNALDAVNSGGSTAGGEGIQLAYKIAKENLITGGNNRVILATDGDFNVGPSSSSDLVDLIEEKRKDDIYLTICGFGMGNYKDGRMEQISNAGNGNYFYIDNIREAQKVFVTEMRANMFTIAKDVKIQIEFNPNTIKAYRLIGYENRLLAKEDFDDDTKDAGELGAGHTVTAIYEVILTDSKSKQTIHNASELKYQKTTSANNANDLMTVKFRYKPIKSESSILLEEVLTKQNIPSLAQTSNNYRFSAAVAGFGMLLRGSEFKGTTTYDQLLDLAKTAVGDDKEGHRAEFLQLIKTAQLLDAPKTSSAN